MSKNSIFIAYVFGLILVGVEISICYGTEHLPLHLTTLGDNKAQYAEEDGGEMGRKKNNEDFPKFSTQTEPYERTSGLIAYGVIEDPFDNPKIKEFSAWKRQETTGKDNVEFKSRPGFRSWGGKRSKFVTWGGKRGKFNNWGGKRFYNAKPNDEVSTDDGLEAPEDVKRNKFKSWGGKRDPEYSMPNEQDDLSDPIVYLIFKGSHLPPWGGKWEDLNKKGFSNWGGK